MHPTKADILEKIAKVKFDEAFTAAKGFILEQQQPQLESLYNDLIQLESRFNRHRKAFHQQGALNDEQLNRLTLSFTQMVNELFRYVDQTETASTGTRSDWNKVDEDMKQAVSARLEDIVVPRNYELETSPEIKFSFCYPKDWAFKKFPRQIQYGAIIDPGSADERFSTNMNVIIDYNDASDVPLPDIYDAGTDELLHALAAHGLKVIAREDFLFKGLEARRLHLEYVLQEQLPLTLYQVSVADQSRERIFHVSFTCLQEKFAEQRLLFDNILSTLRF